MSALREFFWNVRYSRYGWPSLVALALAAVAVPLLLLKVAPMQNQLQALERTGPGRTSTHEAMQHALSMPVDPSQQLGTFYRFFSSSPRPNDALQVIHQNAQKNGIVLAKGEYRFLAVSGTRLQRYQTVLPVNGSYPSIRKFIADVLNEMPTVSLENVRFERPQIGSAQIDAEIRFTLYLML